MEWIAADWPAPAGIVAGCSARQGGVSKGRYASLNLGAHVGDDDAAVLENRRRLKARCDLPAEPGWLSQVHGTTVAVEPILTKLDDSNNGVRAVGKAGAVDRQSASIQILLEFQLLAAVDPGG